MTWPETYNKYKDSTLMKEFEAYLYDAGSPDIGHLIYISDIKDIWGYLVIFSLDKAHYTIEQDVISEEQMLHQAKRFFDEKYKDEK